MILQIFITFLFFFVYYCIELYLKPYLRIQKLLKNDSQNIKKLFHVAGYIGLIKDSEKQYNHSFKFIANIMKKSPQTRLIATNMFNKALLIITDPKLAKIFLQSQNQYKKFEIFYKPEYFDQGLIFQHGKEAAKTRKAMGKMFNYENIKQSHQVILNVTNKIIEQEIQKCQGQKLKMNLLQFTAKITSQIVSKLFFSEDADQQKLNNKDFEQEVVQILDDNLELNRSPQVFFKKFFLGQKFASFFLFKNEKDYLNRIITYDNFIENLIKQRYQKQKNGQYNKEFDMLDYLLEEYKLDENYDYNIKIIKQNYQILIVAGTDTSSHVIAMALYNLANNQQIKAKIYQFQLKLIQEIKETINNLDSDENIQKLDQIIYLTNIIKETLRLHNPGSSLFPRIAQQDLYIDDIFIKKGDMLDLSIYSLNMNSKIFNDPDQFIPDRWNELNLEPYQFLPFSAGSRNCIGQHLAMLEIKIILTQFLLTFDFQPIQNKKLRMILKFTLGPEDDQLIEISKK